MATSTSAQLNPFTIHVVDSDTKMELSVMAVYSNPFTVGQTIQIIDDFITQIPFSEKPHKMYEVMTIQPVIFSRVKGEGIVSKDAMELLVGVREKKSFDKSKDDFEIEML